MIDAETLGAVVRFAGERGRPGTAFVVAGSGGRCFLVTAAHLCTTDPEEQVTIRNAWWAGAEPITLVLPRHGGRDELGDLAAFELPPEVPRTNDGNPVGLTVASGLMPSQECWILGFPYGLLHSHITTLSGQQVPLAKRGAMAGNFVREDGTLGLYLDLIANPGFSGGPVLFRSLISPGQLYVGGVVTGTVTAPMAEPTEDEPNPPRVTSGISLAASDEALADLINGTTGATTRV